MKNYDVYSYNDGRFDKEDHTKREELKEKEVNLTWSQILSSPNCLILMIGFLLLAPVLIFVMIFRGNK